MATPDGTHWVWTKRIGNNPRVRVLLLHGGPAATHEYLEACDSFLPAAGIEYYYYDQLGSGFSAHPTAPTLWELDRFVDEIEQVRCALGLDRECFVLFGHSWGGILAIEYALRHQQHLKGLVISNMTSSVAACNEYVENVLLRSMDPTVRTELEALERRGETQSPRYAQILDEHHNVYHVLRMPLDEWPDPVRRSFGKINHTVYDVLQGPTELYVRPPARLAGWDRTRELATITVPTLVIGARHDTMDPAHMEMMAQRLPRGRYLLCANGSHLAMYDDQEAYFSGLVQFLGDLEADSDTTRTERASAAGK